MTTDGWSFSIGDELEQRPEFQVSVGDVQVETSTKEVTKRLTAESDGKRYYYVTTGHASQLYSADAIESTHQVADE